MLKLKLGAEILQILQILQKKEKKLKQKFPVRQIKMTQKYSSENNLCKSDTQERFRKKLAKCTDKDIAKCRQNIWHHQTVQCTVCV